MDWWTGCGRDEDGGGVWKGLEEEVRGVHQLPDDREVARGVRAETGSWWWCCWAVGLGGPKEGTEVAGARDGMGGPVCGERADWISTGASRGSGEGE